MAILSLVGLAALVVCVVCLVALHLLPTGLAPHRDFVSSYARTRYGYLYNTQAVASGLGAACLLFVLETNPGEPSLVGVIALVAYGLSRLIIPFFAIDGEAGRTIRGRVHNLLAALTFSGISVASLFLATSPALEVLGKILATASVVFLLTFVVRRLHVVAGLLERVIYLGTIGWLTLALIASGATPHFV